MTSKAARAWQTLAYLVDPCGFLDQRWRAEGHTFRSRTWLDDDALFVSHPDDVRWVLEDGDIFLGGAGNGLLRDVVGAASVSSLDGRPHADRRRMLSPALQAARLDDAEIAAVARAELEALPRRRPLSFRPVAQRITLRLMLRAILGDDDGSHGAIGAAFSKLVELGAVPLSQLGAIDALRVRFPASPWSLLERRLVAVDREIARHIAERKARPRRKGAIDALIAARDDHGQPLSDRALRDDVFTLLGAGYETTATALTWALELILLQADLRRAIVDETGGHRWLDAAIHESLRVRPVLPTVTRVTAAPVAVAGVALPSGATVVACLYLAHRVGLPDPGAFRAERFMHAAAPSLLFVPFGGGARRCPGMPIALRQMRAILSALLATNTLSLVRRTPSTPVFRGSTLAPLGGVRVIAG